jgi:phosphate transport system permease protein
MAVEAGPRPEPLLVEGMAEERARWARMDRDVPMRPATFSPDDAKALALAAASAGALMWLVFYKLLPPSSFLGFAICWWLAFLVIAWAMTREMRGSKVAVDRLCTIVVWSAAASVITILTAIIGYVVVRGVKALSLAFFTKTLATAGPLDPVNAGGAAHAIVGTIEQVGIAIAIAVPLGIMCSVFLNEIGGKLKRPVRVVIDAMSGVPTIVAGLFIYATWIVVLGHDFSGFAAALAISISMLPTITRTSEEVLRLVPDGLREASLALGASEWRTVRKVVIPTAKAGLATAVILGVARAVGETAPLIVTSLGSSVMNANPFAGPQSSLPLFVYRQISDYHAVAQQRAWAGALVLICMVLGLFIVARVMGAQQARRGLLRAAPEKIK